MPLFDDYLFNITTYGPMLKEAREQNYVSALFPLVWVALPWFWVGVAIVRLVEGPKRQAFNFTECRRSFQNQLILGFLYSFGPTGGLLLDANKTEMPTVWEWVWKTAAAALIVDAAFYWVHYALHQVPWLRFIHAQHHVLLAKHTVWGAIDEDPLEVLTMFGYLNLPFLLISVSPEFVIIYIAAGAVQTAMMHGSWAGGWHFPPYPLVGAYVHHGHHQTITKNYSGVFVFWDHIMGTYKDVEKDDSKADRSSRRQKVGGKAQ